MVGFGFGGSGIGLGVFRLVRRFRIVVKDTILYLASIVSLNTTALSFCRQISRPSDLSKSGGQHEIS